MADNSIQTTSHILWIEGRKMAVSVAQNTATPSTLHVSWTLPPVPWEAYAGYVVLLSTVQFDSSHSPETGKRYLASSNWAVPADTINEAHVVAANYAYFGDDVSVISVDVTNTDPDTVYYASIHASSNALQYYPFGIQSYPLESDRFSRSTDAYAGSIPSAVTPPPNPVNGQVYFDPSVNKVCVWNADIAVWIETSADKSVSTGSREPILPYQLYINTVDVSMRFFLPEIGWLACSSLNTRVKSGALDTDWVAFNGITAEADIIPGVVGQAIIVPVAAQRGITVENFAVKVFTFGQWVPISAKMLQFEISPGVWQNVVFGDKLWAIEDPVIPEVGSFFYKTATKDLLSWSGIQWIKADTEDEGTPTSEKIGIGDDGSYDDRLNLTRILKTQMGWPTVCNELSEEAFNVAIDNAIQTFRARCDNAYSRRFVLFTLEPGQQEYYLNDPRNKTNSIVNILRMDRVNQLGGAQLNDPVYGQLFIPQTFANGQFDLVSMHLMHQLAETFEKMFAGNLMYTWDEASRQLVIQRQIKVRERIVMEVVMERTEQELLRDRWCQQWLQGWALAEAKEMLGMIRSKYGSVAGPNGGVTLNGDMLISEARLDFEDLMRAINDYEIGNGGTNFGNTSFYIF